MKRSIIYIVAIVSILITTLSFSYEKGNNELKSNANISPETEECIMCHSTLHPGIVSSWENSRHSKISTIEAYKKSDLEKRVSSLSSDSLRSAYIVGCYECHSLNTEKHTDSFEHNGHIINVIVSPNDCASCHNEERTQFSNNMMSHAYANLMDNKLYLDLKASITSEIKFEDGSFHFNDKNKITDADACLHCHGTILSVTGKQVKETDFGEFEFPVIEGWPNHGVGRINPDGSKGSCTACHPLHDFSIEFARKPDACSRCHKGPDVPAYKVYQASKHGNIYNANKEKFDFSNVPWTIGKDFGAPTCATCHASLLVDTENNIIAKRTHQFNNRLASRLFGVPYAHPHPISPETHKIRNSSGQQLPTDLDGTLASEFLIDENEQTLRDNRMKQICTGCHSSSWADNHFTRLNDVIKTSNSNTLTATQLITKIWDEKYADPSNLFDENIERYWVDIWLFHANSIRLSAAMGGGGDYGVFENGRYPFTSNLFYLKEWLENKEIMMSKQNKKKPK